MTRNENRLIIWQLERLRRSMLRVERYIKSIDEQISRLLEPQRTIHLLILFTEENMTSIAATEKVGQSVIASAVPIMADGTATPGSKVSLAKWSISDPTLAEQTDNGDGTATYTALLPGTATVSLSATVTDSDGTAAIFSASSTLTVTSSTSTGHSSGLEILFGTPV